MVGWAREYPPITDGIETVAGVMSGRDAVGANLAGGDEKLVELEMVVAQRARDGSASGEILVDEGTDDVGLEALLLVDDVIRNTKLFGDMAGVVHVVDGAATALNGFGHAFVASETALVPELKREADERVSLRVQERRDRGRINSSRHGDGDGLVRGGIDVPSALGKCRHAVPIFADGSVLLL